MTTSLVRFLISIIVFGGMSFTGTALAHDAILWGPSGEVSFYQLQVGKKILLTASAPESGSPTLIGYKSDQLLCQSVPASYQGSDTNNAKWECTALKAGNSSNSEVFFTLGSNDHRSNSIVIQVDAAEPAVHPEDLQLWGPTAEHFYRIPVGGRILLTAGARRSLNPVLEGVKTEQLSCRVYQSYENENAKWDCKGLRGGNNSNSEVSFTVGGQRSNLIVIQVDAATQSSSASRPTSSVPSRPQTVIPPAGYEDEVLTNFNAYNNPFPDTDIGTNEGMAAAELYRRSVIGGFPDGEFKGNRFVNRAEAAKFLLLARYGSVADVRNSGRFPDVLDGQWYAKYVVTAASLGIISGHPNGLFKPADTVNTAEFLKMLALTFDLRPTGRYFAYEDVPEDAWYASYVDFANAYELFPDRKQALHPEAPLSRAGVAIAIYQYLSNRE